MIRKFLSKYILEVIPSIVATVVGAYIVTNYINAKPPADKPPVAVSAPAQAISATPGRDGAAAKAEAAAKSVAERVAGEKAAAAKAAADKAATEKIAVEKAEARKTAERLASEKREAEKREAEKRDLEKREAERREAEKREHALAKAASAGKAAAPVAKTPEVKPVMESAASPDANDLARAAITRLRAEQPAPVAQPVQKMPEQPVAPVAVAPSSAPVAAVPALPPAAAIREANIGPVEPTPPAAITPLPPASTVTAPQAAGANASRLVPPADIPSRPLDLQAGNDSEKGGGSVVSDMMSATKSAFQAVLPR